MSFQAFPTVRLHLVVKSFSLDQLPPMPVLLATAWLEVQQELAKKLGSGLAKCLSADVSN